MNCVSGSIVDSVCHNALATVRGPVVLGVSGGVDSMVLADAIQRMASGGLAHDGLVPVVAHVNYGLRPGADADTDLVETWCAAHDIPCHTKRTHGRADAPPAGSPQAWARDIRYAFFLDVARQVGAPVVIVGHHADDQAETVALEAGRAAGPGGLMGMVPRRALWTSDGLPSGVDLVRPLLGVDRAAIELAASERNVPWRADPSNEQVRYARARVRERMDERRKHFWLAVSEAATHTVQVWQDTLPKGLRSALLEARSGSTFIPESAWAAGRSAVRPWFVLHLLRALDGRAPRRRSTIHTVNALWSTRPGSMAETGAVIWVRERTGVAVYRSELHPDNNGVVVSCHVPSEGQPPATFPFGAGILEIHAPAAPPDRPDMPATDAWLDAASLAGPLELRPWQAGDRFHPLGAPGRKKVKSFLTDARVPSSTRKRVLVLLSGGSIVWVVGQRLSHEARIRPGTDRAVHVGWRVPDSQG